MRIDQFKDDEVYPVEASTSGDNAFYVQCVVIGQSAPYAACLKKCNDRKLGRLDAQFAECSSAIGQRACPAIHMRQEELDKGQAIHFISRPKLLAHNAYRDRMYAEAAAIKAATGVSKRKPGEEFNADAEIPAFKISGVRGYSLKPADAPQTRAPASYRPTVPGTGSLADAINMAMVEAKEAPVATKPVVPVIERPAMLPGESLLAYARRVQALVQQG